jgi:hypothetical protein
MKNKSQKSISLLTYLKEKKIVTIDEVKLFLNMQARMTVFRKLSQLNYISSCSHRGRYYSLKRIAHFNQNGIWNYKSVIFSKYGTIKKTIEYLIENSSKGYTASELNHVVNVKVDDALLELLKLKVILRKKLSGVYVYYSSQIN